MIEKLKALIEALKKLVGIIQVNPQIIVNEDQVLIPKKSRIADWASAIREQEGFRPGSRSYRNNNPGNIRFGVLTKELGATFADADGFAIFPSYNAGMDALCSFLKLACEDKLKGYHKARTLLEFTKVYANPPDDGYAKRVANRLGVSVLINIKELL